MKMKRWNGWLVAPVMVLFALLVLAACTEEDPTPRSDRPDAPAGIDDDFRSDAGALVGKTGRPQLVEFFTFW